MQELKPSLMGQEFDYSIQHAKDCADKLREKDKTIEALKKALDRQADNMAFILNHVQLSDQWWHKFNNELAEDRTALASVEGV